MRITEGLPTDWNVFRITEAQCRERSMPVECAGWAVTRDHGALVVGIGYVSRDQATYVAWKTLRADNLAQDHADLK